MQFCRSVDVLCITPNLFYAYVSSEHFQVAEYDFNLLDESTCCDDDFTWVCSNPKETSVDSDRPISKYAPLKSSSNDDACNKPIGNGQSIEAPPKPANKTSSKTSASLDRRRVHSRNRHERDTKSRSAHSLQDSSATSTTDYAVPENSMKGELHAPTRANICHNYPNE